jgi:hypothetical protein
MIPWDEVLQILREILYSLYAIWEYLKKLFDVLP